MGAETWPCVKSENIFFLNQSGISALPETWVKQDELYGAILCLFSVIFNVLKQVPTDFSCWRRTLKCCFAVTLQKCSVYCNTSPDFPVTWLWVDSVWYIIFGWTVPLRSCFVWCVMHCCSDVCLQNVSFYLQWISSQGVRILHTPDCAVFNISNISCADLHRASSLTGINLVLSSCHALKHRISHANSLCGVSLLCVAV